MNTSTNPELRVPVCASFSAFPPSLYRIFFLLPFLSDLPSCISFLKSRTVFLAPKLLASTVPSTTKAFLSRFAQNLRLLQSSTQMSLYPQEDIPPPLPSPALMISIVTFTTAGNDIFLLFTCLIPHPPAYLQPPWGRSLCVLFITVGPLYLTHSLST